LKEVQSEMPYSSDKQPNPSKGSIFDEGRKQETDQRFFMIGFILRKGNGFGGGSRDDARGISRPFKEEKLASESASRAKPETKTNDLGK
jgi:hypothetical protein